jgi:transposase
MNQATITKHRLTIGIDLGDRKHQFCILDEHGQILEEGKLDNTRVALAQKFMAVEPALIALEAGTHSPWISAALEEWGHSVLVANPNELAAITKSKKKTDKRDGRMLAKLARVDPELLHPLRHRSRQAQADFALIKTRHALVKARSALINQCRGLVKSMGQRLPKCAAECFHTKAPAAVPVELAEALEPLLRTIGELTTRIRQIEGKLEKLAEQPAYAELAKLKQPSGVGTLTALAFMLAVEDPHRFGHSRQVGAYFGLAAAKDQSGQSDKQCRISKEGNGLVRVLLILCAQHILGPKGQDCELRQWGLKLCERGGKAAKKRAVVAVGRKLACQMHALWLSENAYDPFHAQSKRKPGEPGVAGGGGATARRGAAEGGGGRCSAVERAIVPQGSGRRITMARDSRTLCALSKPPALAPSA